MAIEKITYATKETSRVLDLPEKNKVTASTLNEIKTKYNGLVDAIGEDMPTYDTEEAAASLPSDTIYKTSTGALRIKL